MSEISLSIVCPVYNCAAYLGDLVDALVSNANTPDIEWLFVHDCATDDSREVLLAALDARAAELQCRVLHMDHDVNRGLAAARNTGIDAARGRYVGFIDSDDMPLPGFANLVLATLATHRPKVLEVGFREFARADEVHPGGSIATSSVVAPLRLSHGDQFKLLFRNQFFAWTRIVDRSLLEKVRFADSRKAYEDIPYSMALFCEAGEVSYISTPLIGYRKRLGSITSIRDERFLDQYTQLREAVAQYRSHPNTRKSLLFEWMLARKLCIMLLKGVRINSASARRTFFRGVAADLRGPSAPCPRLIKHLMYIAAMTLSVSTAALGSTA